MKYFIVTIFIVFCYVNISFSETCGRIVNVSDNISCEFENNCSEYMTFYFKEKLSKDFIDILKYENNYIVHIVIINKFSIEIQINKFYDKDVIKDFINNSYNKSKIIK